MILIIFPILEVTELAETYLLYLHLTFPVKSIRVSGSDPRDSCNYLERHRAADLPNFLPLLNSTGQVKNARVKIEHSGKLTT